MAKKKNASKAGAIIGIVIALGLMAALIAGMIHYADNPPQTGSFLEEVGEANKYGYR